MVRLDTYLLSLVSALLVIVLSLFGVPFVFADHVMPGLKVPNYSLSGLSYADIPGALNWYAHSLDTQKITVIVKDQQATYTLADLGITLDQTKTAAQIKQASNHALWPLPHQITPILQINDIIARARLEADFANRLQLPQDAKLTLVNDQFIAAPGKSGQTIDTANLLQQVNTAIADQDQTPIALKITTAAPAVTNNEVIPAQTLATNLLKNGFNLHFNDQIFAIKPFTLQRLINFTEVPDPQNSQNTILGVTLDKAGFAQYLTTTIIPQVDKDAVSARFSITASTDDSPPKVDQFAEPQTGQKLDIDASTVAVNQALAQNKTEANLTVNTINPDITDNANLKALGIDKLLTTGVTDFRGSPKNRVFNITVGASKYQGVLIAPNTEFSFLSFLGPVDGEHGFLPELVIKDNVTTPEFGGGLCQVSTTVFRAAIQAGLKITERHNHSYAVHYYGDPGFDATIYPPYTDLRFLNNTPGYILIQTRIEGTKLIFEFWGTDDGRQVAIDGPHSFDRQSNGAVKATLGEKVTAADGTVLYDDTFRSNYKSPLLFPKVLAANGEAPPQINESIPTTPTTSTTNSAQTN